jgi:hypothetical protein
MNLFDKTLVLMHHIVCPICVSRFTRGRQETGHSVAEVGNVGMKVVKHTDQASLHVRVATFIFKKVCKLLSLLSAVIL